MTLRNDTVFIELNESHPQGKLMQIKVIIQRLWKQKSLTVCKLVKNA